MGHKKMCCVCGAAEKNNIKIKKGYICENCLKEMPISIRHCVENLRPDQIQAIRKVYKRAFRVPWLTCERFALTDTSIQLNGFEYDLKDIIHIKFKFHPLRIDDVPGYARGVITVMIETRDPDAYIEERFIDDDDSVVRYNITGAKISYTFSDDLERIARIVNRALRTKTFDLSRARMEWLGQEGHEEQTESESGSRFKSRRDNKRVEHITPDAIEAAKQLFGIEGLYSSEDLKRIRNEMVKSAHPDAGGSDDEFKKIIAAYKLLEQYAN